MDIVERVARSMCAATGTIWGGPHGEDDPDFLLPKIAYLKMARAAIEAIREPSEAMISAGVDEHNQQGWNDGTDARKVFSAMIGAALSPPP